MDVIRVTPRACADDNKKKIWLRKKIPSFFDSEMVLLLQLYREHKDVLEAKFNTSISNQLKKSTWSKVADKLSEFQTFSNFDQLSSACVVCSIRIVCHLNLKKK